MTFEQAVGVTLIRALVVALLATAIGWRIVVTMLQSEEGRSSFRIARLLKVMLVSMFLMPNVVVGYAWSGGTLSLARFPIGNECLYVVLLVGKFLPLAAGVIYCLPVFGMAASGEKLLGMLPKRSALGATRWKKLLMRLRFGPMRCAVIAFGVVFIFAYQEFELGALLYALAGRQVSAGTWSYKLHEMQQLYVPTATLMGKAGIALLVECLVVAGLVALTWGSWLVAQVRSRGELLQVLASQSGMAARGRKLWFVLSVGAFVILFALNVCVPLFVVVGSAAGGFVELMGRFRLGDELIASIYIAVFVMVFTLFVVWLVQLTGLQAKGVQAKVVQGDGDGRAKLSVLRGVRIVLVGVLCVVGLIGPLMLSVLVLEIFSWSVLFWLSDTPVRLIVGMVIWMTPVVLLIRLASAQNEKASGDHAGRLLRQSGDRQQRQTGVRVWLAMHGRAWYGLGALVFVLAYFELVMSVTLSASRMTPMIVELYNQMHYGQRALLSATVVIALACPLLMWAVAIVVRRVVARFV